MINPKAVSTSLPKARSEFKYKCLLLARVSTFKQMQEGESPEFQIERGLSLAKERFQYKKPEVFIMVETCSGRKEERPTLDQAFEIVQKHNLKHLLIYDIDRLTRAGAGGYELIKRRFKEVECEIVDTKGIIQPERNILEGTGGEFGSDFTYEWSIYSTSEKAEIMEAQMAKDEARKILGRTLPIQIKNVQQGRTNRPALYGYKNCKIIDETGKPQPSKKIFDEEAFYVKKAYQDIASGMDVRQLCDKLNRLGYKSRIYCRWNASHTQIIGHKGGNPINPKILWEMIRRPIYAGFILEKWTCGFPVKANHEGIVSLELWNKANQGFWAIIKSDKSPSSYELINLKKQKSRRIYLTERADFPFKKFVHCSNCQKPFKASYSKSASGKRFGYYHCNRGHRQISIRKEQMEDLLKDILKKLKFSEDITDRFEEKIREVFIEKVGELNKHIAHNSKEIASLRDEADMIFEKIKLTSSKIIIKRLEQEFEELESRIKLLEANRNQKEFSEDDIKRAIKWARYLVEHLDELIIACDDERLKHIFWNLIFIQNPNLDELKNRTCQLSPIIRLKGDLKIEKSALVSPQVFKSNEIIEELMRWANCFDNFKDKLESLLVLKL